MHKQTGRELLHCVHRSLQALSQTNAELQALIALSTHALKESSQAIERSKQSNAEFQTRIAQTKELRKKFKLTENAPITKKLRDVTHVGESPTTAQSFS
jgi:hypothetical protein